MTDTTSPQTADLPARLEAVLTERFTELGNPFSRMRIAFQGPDGWPASKEVGPRDVAEVLRELLAAAPPAADRADELAKHVTRAIFALKSPAPPGSEHYRSGWDDGLEAAIDAARDAVLRRVADEAQQPSPRCTCGETACESELCDCDSVPCPVDHADEAQQPETQAHPAEHTWAAELYDPLTEEWVPGTRYLVRDRAVNALTHARSIGPTWRDGTPTERRLVRATTTYTVETPTAAPVAGQPPADTTGEEAGGDSEADLSSKTRPKADSNTGTEETVHSCPPDGSGLTPCCGRTPFELPLTDRISSEVPVTCKGADRG